MTHVANGVRKLQTVEPRSATLYDLPAYGFVVALELRPNVPTANMDGSRPLRLYAELRDGDGALVPCSLIVHSEGCAP